jgi:hypothetical protein
MTRMGSADIRSGPARGAEAEGPQGRRTCAAHTGSIGCGGAAEILAKLRLPLLLLLLLLLLQCCSAAVLLLLLLLLVLLPLQCCCCSAAVLLLQCCCCCCCVKFEKRTVKTAKEKRT